MISWSVLDRGDNLSDHNPSVVELSTTLNTLESSTKNIRLPKWKTASEAQINLYKMNLNSALNNIDIPFEALLCENLLCTDHKEDIEHFLGSIINACKRATSASIPLSAGGGGRGGVPGWNATVIYSCNFEFINGIVIAMFKATEY